MKTLMILGASILQLPAIEQATAMGLKVVALDMNPAAVGFQVPGVISEVISTIDIPAAVAAARRHQIDGVMTLATDMPMRTVAAIAEALHLVGVSSDTAQKATDKSLMRDCLSEFQVPIPKYFKVRTLDEYLAAVESFRTPFVVKPADSSGSRGIYLVKEISDAGERRKAYDYTKPFSHTGMVVVEEYMTGPEVSVETLAWQGEVAVIQITDKITTGAPHFVEMGHTQPTRLPADTAEAIRRVAIAANHALGIANGPSHTEIIVTSEGPKIVELGARLGGDCITTHLVPLSTGVNMVENCIRIALGEAPDMRPRFSRGAAIRYFRQHAGIVRSIIGVEAARRLPGVRQVSVVHGVGETVTEITDSASRMGFVIAQGEDAVEAASFCEQARDAIRVDIA